MLIWFVNELLVLVRLCCNFPLLLLYLYSHVCLVFFLAFLRNCAVLYVFYVCACATSWRNKIIIITIISCLSGILPASLRPDSK